MEKLESRFQLDLDVTIVAPNLPEEMESEDVMLRKAEHVDDNELRLADVKIVRAKRLVSRNGNSGIVKIELASLEDKIRVLRVKQNLKMKTDFKDVCFRSSKSHIERLQELNSKVMLQELPNGHRYRLTANGRLVPNDDYGNGNGSFRDNDGGF